MKTNTDDAGLSAFGTELKPPYFTAGGWVSPLNFLPEVRAQWTVPKERRDPRRHAA